MLRHASNKSLTKGLVWFVAILGLLCFSACQDNPNRAEVDRLNSISYAYHYKNIDSTIHYANAALLLSDKYDGGKAEALNNLAFVHIVKMEYDEAERLLNEVINVTDNTNVC